MDKSELITGMPELRKAIKSVATSASKVNARIHVVAVSCFAHVRDHNDWTPAAMLLNALPTGTRVKALAYWFKYFSNGKLTFSKNDEGEYRGHLAKDRNRNDFDVDNAWLTPFGDLTVEKSPSVLTTDKLIKLIAQRAKKDEYDKNGTRVTTRAAVTLAANLERYAEELKNSDEFAELRAEEQAVLESSNDETTEPEPAPADDEPATEAA